MRTHRIKITCSSEEFAKEYEENIVHQYFVDFTHWFCGFDGAGEDTPDECLIYRGIIEPNSIYIEFNAKSIANETIEKNANNVLSFFKSQNNDNIKKLELKKLESYDKILNLQKQIETLKYITYNT